MFKKNLALAIMGLFAPAFAAPQPSVDHEQMFGKKATKSKGQIRAAKGKPSGAAQFKRAAKKRANIRKHS